MIAFILIFFGIYSLLHLYIYKKVCSGLSLSGRGKALLVAILSLNTLSPTIWRTIDSAGNVSLTFITAFTSLFLMGAVVYFFLSGIAVDIISRFKPFSPGKKLGIIVSITAILSIYSHIETYNLQVYRFTIETNKLPSGVELKILHISDLHLGPVMREDRIDMVRKVYEREKPDLIVATGDMVDGNMSGHDGLAKLLSEINPPLGKFAVLGNHEFYRGYRQAIEFMKRAGFRILRGEWAEAGNHIAVAGVDDDAGTKLGFDAKTDELKAIEGIDTRRFIIFIKHEPKLRDETVKRIDLFLAGHTHGGVLFFVGYTVLRMIYFTDRGMAEIAPGKYAIVSKGVGTGGPPMRLFSPPDVVVIKLVGKG